MFKETKSFSSFSVNDLVKAKEFYAHVLGVTVEEDTTMGLIHLHLANGQEVMLYPKENHTPATFTVLNFIVENIDHAVDQLIEKGITFEQYTGEYLQTDEKGISRGGGKGPQVAWLKDPAGNILAVMQVSK